MQFPLNYLDRVARKKGDVARIRFGPFQVWVLSHPDYVRDVLMTNANRFRKGPVLQRARVVLGDGLLTSEGDVHRAHRDLLQPGFHPHEVSTYVPQMQAAATSTAQRWQPDVPIDVHREMVRLTLSTAGATLLGADVDHAAPIIESAVNDLLSAYHLAFVPLGRFTTSLPTRSVRRLRRGQRTLYQLVDQMLVSGNPSALHQASATLSPDQIRQHAVTMLLAGHETTANALAFACHLLAHNPEAARRLQDEADAATGGTQEPSSLPYARAVLGEALRLYPPSWAMTRRAVAAHELSSGRTVAKGDIVVLPQWVVHRDPRWWDEPGEFRPERWLDESAKLRPRWAYFPFGAGIRRCIGEGFAWAEGAIVLATLARRWRLLPVPGRSVTLQPRMTLRPKDGVWLRPSRR